MTIRIALVIILVAFSGYFFGARPSTVAFAADSIAQKVKKFKTWFSEKRKI